jgi:hypothetical protein
MKLTKKQEMRVRVQLVAWFADSVSGWTIKELEDHIMDMYGQGAIEAMASEVNLTL